MSGAAGTVCFDPAVTWNHIARACQEGWTTGQLTAAVRAREGLGDTFRAVLSIEATRPKAIMQPRWTSGNLIRVT